MRVINTRSTQMLISDKGMNLADMFNRASLNPSVFMFPPHPPLQKSREVTTQQVMHDAHSSLGQVVKTRCVVC